ncbi:MAG: YceI family protein, partial [Bacteroidota bacterium]
MRFLVLFLSQLLPLASPSSLIFVSESGRATFVSEAPLEIIEARSSDLKGLLDLRDGAFAFTIDLLSFDGFNSPLQREHFNENYLESTKFPKATFSGRIIEQIDLSQPGSYDIRAKGILDIHGVEQERIIRVNILSDPQEMKVNANFFVLLEDHNIRIPKVVYQKIA